MVQHEVMKAYSEDLRKKMVDAVEQRGMQQNEAARLFDVSFSSVKRYVRKSRQGRPLSPGKAPGKHPAMDQRARKLLEEDLKERPFLTLQDRREYLGAVASVDLSRSTLRREIKRMNSTRKKGADQPRNATSS